MLYDWDAELLQLGLVADARLHQHFGGMDRAQRQHYFGPRANPVDGAVVGELHAGGPATVEGHSGHQSAGEHGEIPPVLNGGDVGTKHRLANAVADSQVYERRATVAL